MKKLLLTACCIVILSLASQAQLDTIPNAGFENWYYTPIWTIEATGWQTNNSSIAAWNVVPDSLPHTGLLGLKIQKISYRGTIWSGFPLSQHPLALDCFIKNGLNLGDTAFIHIHVYSANVIVDSGYAEIYGGIGTNYLPFSVNISQNVSVADSCIITLEGGNIYMSSVSFDDLSLSFPTSIEEQNTNAAWNIFPNPCNDVLTLTGINEAGETSTITFSDAAGKIIREEKLFVPKNNSRVINTQSLCAGVYLLSITAGEKRSSHLVIKN